MVANMQSVSGLSSSINVAFGYSNFCAVKLQDWYWAIQTTASSQREVHDELACMMDSGCKRELSCMRGLGDDRAWNMRRLGRKAITINIVSKPLLASFALPASSPNNSRAGIFYGRPEGARAKKVTFSGVRGLNVG